MGSPSEVAKKFYEAFAAHDGDTMASLYAPDATFSDPVFPKLNGKEAGQMWRMLCSRAEDLEVEFAVEEETGDTVEVNWDATYTFTKTGRPVTNAITTKMTVKNGKITAQEDKFPFWQWATQAFGNLGLLLGWTKKFQKKVQDEAAKGLKAFQEK